MCLVAFIFLNSSFAGRAKQKIELGPQATNALTGVFNQMERLHDVLFDQNQNGINSELRAFRSVLGKAMSGTKKERIYSQHINRVLGAVLNLINTAINTQGEQRNKNLKDAFKQLEILFETYKTPVNLKVYWCHIDRSVWLQKAGKIQNPFEPKSNCGRLTK